MSKKIAVLGLAVLLMAGAIFPGRTSASVDSIVEELVIKGLEPRFSFIEKDIIFLKVENLSLREEIRLLKETINKITITTPAIETPTSLIPAEQLGNIVRITKKYIRYKNGVEVYDSVTGRHIGWGEAQAYNIWNDIQDLPYVNPSR